jgi:hypothetical protein
MTVGQAAAPGIGARVSHPQFGPGVVVSAESGGYVRAFFESGERQVPVSSLSAALGRAERIVSAVAAGEARSRRAWLCWQAHALPLLEGAAGLTSAKIDLLPHQVVLTHRITTTSPRRFLVADEVGLGKTIETALILRELASRGELDRALMVVPAGLVNNWHREMNEVFRLDFEVFGSEGDVTDRKSNAFAKHDRLIASVDTLKRKARIKRLLEEAPPWDLVVFDEAHHLTAYRNGKKVTKTENYKLAEALKGHARDLVLLSATPHQGDHFRFWMLVQLLNPTLFKSPEDMVDNRHRLNSVVFRRTKGRRLSTRRFAALRAALGPHRVVHDGRGGAHVLRGAQGVPRGRLRARPATGQPGPRARLRDDDLPEDRRVELRRRRRTLRRRILMLTLHEAILKDQELDIDARDAAPRRSSRTDPRRVRGRARLGGARPSRRHPRRPSREAPQEAQRGGAGAGLRLDGGRRRRNGR